MTEIITTAEELDTLPVGGVVADVDRETSIWQLGAGRLWWTTGSTRGYPSRDMVGDGSAYKALYLPGRPAPSLPPTMEQITAVIMGHRPSRWRSFSNDAEILRCCGIDFGTATKKLKPGEDGGAWTSWSSHVAEAVHKLYPTCQPSREQIEEAIQSGVELGYNEQDVAESTGYGSFDGRPLDVLPWVRGADAILALLPGRSEAEVKAEALREHRRRVVRTMPGGFVSRATVLADLDEWSQRLAGGEQ